MAASSSWEPPYWRWGCEAGAGGQRPPPFLGIPDYDGVPLAGGGEQGDVAGVGEGQLVE